MAAIAAAVLLVYGLILLLDHVAARQQAQAAVRRQLKLAADRMAEHALVCNHPTGPTPGRASFLSQQPMTQPDHLRRASRTEPGLRVERRISRS